MEEETLSFELPVIPGRAFFKAIDTSQDSPADASGPGSEPAVGTARLSVDGRSAVVLVAR
jgi:hypothetical protein